MWNIILSKDCVKCDKTAHMKDVLSYLPFVILNYFLWSAISSIEEKWVISDD